MYKQGRLEEVFQLFKRILFNRSSNYYEKEYLIPISNYIFRKMLNACEKLQAFGQHKVYLFSLLNRIQNQGSEVLYTTLYVFILRNLLKSHQLREVNQLLENSAFPYTADFSNLCKFLFYKSVFKARVGQFQLAFDLMQECVRKVPSREGGGPRKLRELANK